jgi:hypothetical protein
VFASSHKLATSKQHTSNSWSPSGPHTSLGTRPSHLTLTKTALIVGVKVKISASACFYLTPGMF